MMKTLLPRLASELSEIRAGEVDSGLMRLFSLFGECLDAPRQALVITVREPANDIGWRIGGIAVRSELAPAFSEIAEGWRDRKYVASCKVAHHARSGAGEHRVVHPSAELDRDIWETSLGKSELVAHGYLDQIYVIYSLGDVEVFFCLDRAAGQEEFDADEVEALRPALPLLGRFCRWLTLSYGATADGPLLTPRQRTVLLGLLSGQSEKEIATKLGLTVGSTHQVVVKLFRRFDVRSRPELMALWLGGDVSMPDESPGIAMV